MWKSASTTDHLLKYKMWSICSGTVSVTPPGGGAENRFFAGMWP